MANTKIHPTSVISPDAEIADGVEIGPYCLIQGKVKIGKGTFVEGQVTLGYRHGILEIGENNHFSPGAVIGGPPQDHSYKGEVTKLIIGSNNTFREFSTVNLATSKGDGITQVGSHNYFMAYTHVGHDCKIGNHVTIANNSHLGGHCIIEDSVIISGVCAFNQFTKIGRGAFIAGNSVVNKDIVPFCRAQGSWATIKATNKIGLARQGFSRDEIANVHKAIRIIILGSHTVDEGIQRIKEECTMSPNLEYFVNFIKTSKRGIAVDRSPKGWQDDE
jgi:UDP-N-acetylglucosamine acyltransferase